MLFLQFAGANQVADVWVNGTHLGQHQGGYARFRFGATAALTPGRRTCIAVKVTNAANPDIAPLSADYTFQGGIYRNVSLYAVDKLARADARLRRPRRLPAPAQRHGVLGDRRRDREGLQQQHAPAAPWWCAPSSPTPTARSWPTRAARPQTLAAGAGADVVQTLTIANPRRWDGLADPTSTAPTSRSGTPPPAPSPTWSPSRSACAASVDADHGLLAQRQALGLHGVNLHQDRPVSGWAVRPTRTTRQDWRPHRGARRQRRAVGALPARPARTTT